MAEEKVARVLGNIDDEERDWMNFMHPKEKLKKWKKEQEKKEKG